MNRNRFCVGTTMVAVSSVICCFLIGKKQKINGRINPMNQNLINPAKYPYQAALLFEQKMTEAFDYGLRSAELIYDIATQIEQLIDQVELKLK